MIQNITIQNFKALQNNTFELKNLNVLTGLNGVGKSSLIQSLLLLRQSYLKGDFNLPTNLTLNSALTSLGAYQDAIFQDFRKDEDFIKFEINFEESDFSLQTQSYSPESEGNSVLSSELQAVAFVINEPLFSLRKFQCIQAHRGGIVDFLPANNQHLSNKDFGVNGEHSMHYFLHNSNENIPISELAHEDQETQTLRYQVNAWMSEISPNVEVASEYDEHNKTKIVPLFKWRLADGIPSKAFKSKNVGFGIHYTFSVVLALLAAEKGDLIIIENPEAHIHPHGQSKLALLIALAAQNGVQIILETHSDHILNGILIAAKRFTIEEKGIQHDNVTFIFFEREIDSLAVKTTQLNVSEEGNIENPPKYFFDQFDKDLDYLI